jgi:hypothetical protein
MRASAARQIVVLPAPEGAESMKMIPRLGGKALINNPNTKCAALANQLY